MYIGGLGGGLNQMLCYSILGTNVEISVIRSFFLQSSKLIITDLFCIPEHSHIFLIEQYKMV